MRSELLSEWNGGADLVGTWKAHSATRALGEFWSRNAPQGATFDEADAVAMALTLLDCYGPAQDCGPWWPGSSQCEPSPGLQTAGCCRQSVTHAGVARSTRRGPRPI